jgi:hypothetical protein
VTSPSSFASEASGSEAILQYFRESPDVSAKGAFPDKDANRPATRGDILLLAQYMEQALAKLEDIEAKVSPPQPEFNSGWQSLPSKKAILVNVPQGQPVRDLEGKVRFNHNEDAESWFLPHEDPIDGKVYIRGDASDGTITVINTTPHPCEVRVKGHYLEGT